MANAKGGGGGVDRLGAEPGNNLDKIYGFRYLVEQRDINTPQVKIPF